MERAASGFVRSAVLVAPEPTAAAGSAAGRQRGHQPVDSFQQKPLISRRII